MDNFESGYVKRAVEDLHADFREFKLHDKEWKDKAIADREEMRKIVACLVNEKANSKKTWATIAKGSQLVLAGLCAAIMLKLGDATEFTKQLFRLLTL